jgi:hypothetical protein
MRRLDDPTPATVASMCAGKERHVSAVLAHRIAKRRWRIGKYTVAYRCQCCGYWHLGTPMADDPPARRLRR